MYLCHKHLIIRDALVSDAALLCRWWNDGAVMEHAGFPQGIHTTIEQVTAQILQETGPKYRLIIESHQTPIGEMCYQEIIRHKSESKYVSSPSKIMVWGRRSFPCSAKVCSKIMDLPKSYWTPCWKTKEHSTFMKNWALSRLQSIGTAGRIKQEKCAPASTIPCFLPIFPL